MRKFLLLPILLLGWPAFGEVDFEGRMPEDLIPELKMVIAAALENSDTMAELQLNEAQAKGRRIAYRSAVLPSFNARFSFRQERDDDAGADAEFEERLVYAVTFSQPLYHWGARKSEKQIGDLQYEIQLRSNQQRVDDFIMRIRQDYLGLIVAKQKLELSDLDLESIQKQFDFQESQIEAGAAAVHSINRYKLEFDREQLSNLRHEADYLRRLEELAFLVSMDVGQLESLIADEIPAFEILSEEEASQLQSEFSEAIEVNDELKRLDLDLEMEKRRLKIEKMALRPKLNAELGLSSNALDVDGTRREQAYSYFGISVAWSIFDGFKKKGRTLEVLNRIGFKESSKKSLEHRVANALEMSLRRLKIEQKALTLQEWILMSDKGQYEWVMENFEAERVSSVDAENAEKRFIGSSLSTQSSRISYLVALAQLAVDMGQDPLWEVHSAE